VTSFDLRPLTIGELLDRSFTLYRRHLTLFVGIMAAPSVFALATALVLQVLVRPPTLDPKQPPDLEVLLPTLVAGLIGYVALMSVYWIVYLLALGATTLAVADIYAGTASSIRDAYARVRQYIGRLLLLSLLTLVRTAGVFIGLIAVLTVVSGLPMYLGRGQPIIVGLGAFVIIVGTVVAMILAWLFTLRYAVSVPALVLEQVTARNAIRRSVSLTKGYLGRAFLLTLCVLVVMYATMAIFQGPFLVLAVMAPPLSATAFWMNIAGAVSGSVGMALTTPVAIVGCAVLYYDLRVRKEALDLQVMMGALDVPSAGPMSGAAPLTMPAPPVVPE
jgi:MFS family permease